MLKKLIAKFLVVVLLAFFTVSDLTAQTQVRFARGRNSATLGGTISSNGGKRSYVLKAQRGQVLTATLSSTNGKVDFTQGALHDTQFSKTIEQDGNVYVDIDNHGGRTRYTLTISIQ